MVTEWVDFLLHRGIRVDESPGLERKDALLEVLGRNNHDATKLDVSEEVRKLKEKVRNYFLTVEDLNGIVTMCQPMDSMNYGED